MTHFGHTNIIEYSNRPFRDADHMDACLIANWNDVVQPNDTIYIVGDFSFHRDSNRTASILHQLHGYKHLIRGNHDPRKADWFGHFVTVSERKVINEQKQRIVLDHYAGRTWYGSHRGTWQLYGHCVDLDTEVLTTAGWRSRDKISIRDRAIGYNHDSGLLEDCRIFDIVDVPNYTGDVYCLDTKSTSSRLTANHNCIRFSRDGRLVYEEAADIFHSRKRNVVLGSGMRDKRGSSLPVDLIKLYILLVADGSIKESTNLARLISKKPRKYNHWKGVLDRCGIQFSEYRRPNGYVSLNFYVPDELRELQIKGLDDAILDFNATQFEAVLDAYAHSDGCANGKGIIIYSSKEHEIDLLQALAVQSGYTATKYARTHGFSKEQCHQLSVFPRKFVIQYDVASRHQKYRVDGEHFWCITCTLGNFIMRRNGKVHLTGNSHGNLPDLPTALQLDVGVDCHDYTPVSFNRVATLMARKTFEPVDRRG